MDKTDMYCYLDGFRDCLASCKPNIHAKGAVAVATSFSEAEAEMPVLRAVEVTARRVFNHAATRAAVSANSVIYARGSVACCNLIMEDKSEG